MLSTMNSIYNHREIVSIRLLNRESMTEFNQWLKAYSESIDTVWLYFTGSETNENDLYNAHIALGRLFDEADRAYINLSNLCYIDAIYSVLVEEVIRTMDNDEFVISHGLLKEVCELFASTFSIAFAE